MGTTTNLGIVYPDSSGVPSRENWVENPLKSVDAKVVEYLRKRVKSGDSSGTIAIGQVSVDVTINFTTGFASTPSVTPTPRTTSAYAATLLTKSATSFTVRLFRPTGAATSAAATVPFDWTASDLGNA